MKKLFLFLLILNSSVFAQVKNKDIDSLRMRLNNQMAEYERVRVATDSLLLNRINTMIRSTVQGTWSKTAVTLIVW